MLKISLFVRTSHPVWCSWPSIATQIIHGGSKATLKTGYDINLEIDVASDYIEPILIACQWSRSLTRTISSLSPIQLCIHHVLSMLQIWRLQEPSTPDQMTGTYKAAYHKAWVISSNIFLTKFQGHPYTILFFMTVMFISKLLGGEISPHNSRISS